MRTLLLPAIVAAALIWLPVPLNPPPQDLQSAPADSRPASRPAIASRGPAKPPPNPLAGTWQLVRIARVGVGEAAREVRGYVVFTRTHVSMHLWENSPLAAVPRVHSSFCACQVANDTITTSSLLGVFNNEDGELTREPQNVIEKRKFTLLNGGTELRIYKSEGTWLELRRIDD